MDRKVAFAYYKDKIEIEIPEENLIDVLTPKEVYPANDLDECINNHLDHTVGTAPFNQLLLGKKNICIIVCDLTRPMQTDRVLAVLFQRIKRVAPTARVKILVALGTHRPLSDAEIDTVCGKGVREQYEVVNHDCNDIEQLTYVQDYCKDVPVYVNKLLYESDFRIAIGAVKPHPVFGWSGGAKIVIPGVAGYAAIGMSHWKSCAYKGTEIMGRVENEIRKEVEGIVVGNGLLDFVINAVLTEDSRIADVRCGGVVEAHRACTEIANKYYMKASIEPADAVLVGVGKWGSDLWVGSMAVYQSEFFVKKGGVIVLLGNFPEGVSQTHSEILQWGYKPYLEVKKLVDDGVLSADLTLAAHLVHLGRVLEARSARCMLLSTGISKEDAVKLGFGYFEREDQIIPWVKEQYGDSMRVLAMPGFNSTPIITKHPID